MARVRRIAADAAYDSELGIAGLGVGVASNFLQIARSLTAEAGSTHEGEALAVLQALDYMADERGFQPGAEVLTDSASVVRAVRSEGSAGIEPSTVRQIVAMLDAHGYTLRKASRSETQAAHRAARMALRSWRAGRAGVGGWSAARAAGRRGCLLEGVRPRKVRIREGASEKEGR